jgi:hypothetical protein
MERTIISWNLPNWITVVIMASLGYAALAAMAQLVKKNNASSGQAGG